MTEKAKRAKSRVRPDATEVQEEFELPANQGDGRQAQNSDTSHLTTLLFNLFKQQEERQYQQSQEQIAREERRWKDEQEREQQRLKLERERLQWEQEKHRSDQKREEEKKKERELDRRQREVAQLPWMKEDEDVQQYLHSFEERMAMLEIPQERWLSNLKSLLSQWAKGVIHEMDIEDSRSYLKVKKALLKSYDSAQGSLVTRAVRPEKKSGQSPGEFIAQVHRAWDYWTEGLTKREIATQGTMAVIEPMLPYQCRDFVQARNPQTVQDFIRDVEKFFQDRHSSWDDYRWQSRKPTWMGYRQPRGDQGRQEQHKPTQDDHQRPATSSQPGSRDDRGLRLQRLPVTCYICNERGHISRNCPQRGAPVKRLQTVENFGVQAHVNNHPTKAQIDSGAVVTVVPTELVPRSAFTGKSWRAQGLTGGATLPIAEVTLKVNNTSSRMRVLAKEGQKEVIVGTDFPNFQELLQHSGRNFQPTDWVLGKPDSNDTVSNADEEAHTLPNGSPMGAGGEDGLAEEAEDVKIKGEMAEIFAVKTRAQQQKEEKQKSENDQASDQSGADPVSNVDEEVHTLPSSSPTELGRAGGEDSLAEEAEDVKIEGERIEMFAVKTRAQQHKEEKQKSEDDRASDQSGANPVPLQELDESLFMGGKQKRVLTKQQKRIQGKERVQKKAAASQQTKSILDLTQQEMEEEQQADESLEQVWTAAQDGKDGFYTKGGLLRHTSTDDWGDSRDQLVVPQQFRIELTQLAHASHLGAHLGAKKTASKILRKFFWKGLTKDVKQYCRSCTECQKGSRGKLMKAPLQPLHC